LKYTLLILFVLCMSSSLVQQACAQSKSGTNAIRLDHLVYLTHNLDSLTKQMQSAGLRIQAGKRSRRGVETNLALLADGTYFELQSTNATDTDDWRFQALARYGDHVTALVFQVGNLDSLRTALEQRNVSTGAALTGEMTGDSERHTGLPAHYWRAFGPETKGPLDIVFLDSSTRLEPDQTAEGPSRINWLLLSTSPREEIEMRNILAAIGLTRLHEGCCDYWLAGPPDARIQLRFDPAPPKSIGTEGWLSIEPTGIIYSYR
jgi:hypothetical protein